jgi:hypothetical protein
VTVKEKGRNEHLDQNIEKAIEAVDSYDSDTGIELITELLAYDFGEETNRLLENALKVLKNFDYDDAEKFLKTISQQET